METNAVRKNPHIKNQANILNQPHRKAYRRYLLLHRILSSEPSPTPTKSWRTLYFLLSTMHTLDVSQITFRSRSDAWTILSFAKSFSCIMRGKIGMKNPQVQMENSVLIIKHPSMKWRTPWPWSFHGWNGEFRCPRSLMHGFGPFFPSSFIMR